MTQLQKEISKTAQKKFEIIKNCANVSISIKLNWLIIFTFLAWTYVYMYLRRTL